MRKCCCCISVHVGSTILGLLAIVLTLLELSVLIPYLLDIDEFNPIRDNLNSVYFQLEKTLQQQADFTEEDAKEIVKTAQEYTWISMVGEACFTSFNGLIALLMICGVQCKQRVLMLPYLIVQMLIILIFIAAGVLINIGLYFLSVIMGAIFTIIFLLAAFLFIYFWSAVQKAYVELGNRDYQYSPAPMKPIYNPDQHKYHPSAPQHFQMQ